MKSTENIVSNQGRSSAKSWLQGIFSLLVALDVVRLIGAVVTSNASGIGLALISITVNGVMLTAIVKKWGVVLNIGRIILILGIVLGLIVIVIGGIEIATNDDLTESEKNLLIVYEVVLSFGIICNIIVMVLLGRYTAELESASYA